MTDTAFWAGAHGCRDGRPPGLGVFDLLEVSRLFHPDAMVEVVAAVPAQTG